MIGGQQKHANVGLGAPTTKLSTHHSVKRCHELETKDGIIDQPRSVS